MCSSSSGIASAAPAVRLQAAAGSGGASGTPSAAPGEAKAAQLPRTFRVGPWLATRLRAGCLQRRCYLPSLCWCAA
jgi:hypothetical protein